MGKLSKKAKCFNIGLALFGLIFVIWFVFEIFEIGKSKPDYDKFKSAMKVYLDNNEDIIDIIITDNNSFKVIVEDNWYYSSEKDKLKFCDNVRDTTWVYANQYNLISDNESIYVYVYDVDNIRLAEFDMYDFKILR